MGRTLPSGRRPSPPGDAAEHVVRHRASVVRLDRAGGDRQRDEAGPDAGSEVGGLVDRASGARLHRRLRQGYGDDDGRGELLAGVRAQGGRAAGHHVVDITTADR